MKLIFISFLFLSIYISTSFASNMQCDLSVHAKNNSLTDPAPMDEINYDIWEDLDSIFGILDINNDSLIISTYDAEIVKEYQIIYESDVYISAELKIFDYEYRRIEEVIFDKKNNLLTITNTNPFGISIYEGLCS